MFKNQTKAYTHMCQLISKKTGKVLVCESNDYPPFKQKYKWTLHAEEQAIDKLLSLLRSKVIPYKEVSKGVHLFSFRLSKTGLHGMAKPCYRCMQNILKNSKLIRSIQWTDYNGSVNNEMKTSEIHLCNFKRSGGDPRNENRYENNIKSM